MCDDDSVVVLKKVQHLVLEHSGEILEMLMFSSDHRLERMGESIGRENNRGRPDAVTSCLFISYHDSFRQTNERPNIPESHI